MEYTTVSSSNVSAIAYDDNGQILGIRFHKSGEYHYFGVPREVFEGFWSAPSVGIYFNQNVKNAGYAFRPVG
jgi:hypothetical protein